MIIRKDSLSNLTKSIIRTVRYLFSGAPVMAPNEVFRERLDICNSCPKNLQGQCQVCTCFISIKTLFAGEKCPDQPSRWNRLTFSPKIPTDL